MNYGKFYDDFIDKITEEDREEINNMINPDYTQVKRINDYIASNERNFYNFERSDIIKFNCWIYMKLFIKCYESSPEYYI